MNRLNSLRETLKEKNMDGLLLTRMADIAWLSGFTGSTAYILVTQDLAVFVTDGRYETQCHESLAPFWTLEIVTSYTNWLKNLKIPGTLWLQNDAPCGLYRELAKAAICEDDLMQLLRMVKDDGEIRLLREEYCLAGEAFLRSLEVWQYGQGERTWAAQLEYNMMLSGARGASFDTIVASGARGALPHGVASDKIINEADAVTIDFGSRRLYNSDYTRVVYAGKDTEILKIINSVREALEAAMDIAKPGIMSNKLDAAARSVLEKAGYGAYFNHGLGHGVGVEVHELPRINRLSSYELQSGMVFTIEPGVYIPGKYGVRLEETICVNETGCTLLSNVLNKYVYTIS